MERNKSMPVDRTYVPQGLLDAIARLKNDHTGEIRHHSTEERFLPPSIKLSSSTKRWLQSVNHVESSMYVVRGPSNILPVYQGVAGANQSITPAGGLAALGGGVQYIVLDEADNVTVCPTILQYGGVKETNQYRIYAIDGFGNFSYVQRFVLRSVTSDVVNNDMVVANIIWTLPNHVANSSIGTITPSWITTSIHSDVLMQIMDVNNVALNPTVAINNMDSISFRVGDKGTTLGNDITFSYRLYTAGGNVSAIETATVPMIFNTPPLLDGFVTNLPNEMLKGQVFPWVWGGGLDIDNDDIALDIISLYGATVTNEFDINAGIVTPLTVTGDVGEVIVMVIRLKDRFGVSVSRRITSNIIVDPPIVDDMAVLLDNVPIEAQNVLRPCDVVSLEYNGIVDTSGRDITISLSSPHAGVVFSTSVFGQGVETIMTVPCGFDTSMDLEINAIISNGISSVTRTDLVNVSSHVGHELVNYSRIFIKPAGVTALTVVGKGGIGESTVLTGLITHTFVGAPVTDTVYPQPSTVLFDNLTGDTASITVTLATNTVLNFHWG